VFAVLLAACTPPATAAAPEAAPPSAAAPTRAVAVTIDDLIVGGRDLGLVRDRKLTEDLLASVTAAGVPAVGFVNEAKLCTCDERPARLAILRLWSAAGLELGNHTATHPSLTRTPLAEYEADVIAGEPTIRALQAERGQPLRWFRHPFLHTGPDLATRGAFEAFLAQRGYAVAPVTLDNADWMFNFVYTDALTRGDQQLADRVAAAFLAHIEASVVFYEGVEQTMFGRPIHHVLLLHANQLNADHFAAVAAMLRRRGYAFITLEQALADPAYREPDTYAGPAGVSWMYRWDHSRGRKQVDWRTQPEPPTFVNELYEAALKAPPP
jgi:peptidoglycan/xylan/chitin deacetylase (PgdA/CDA1 family)